MAFKGDWVRVGVSESVWEAVIGGTGVGWELKGIGTFINKIEMLVTAYMEDWVGLERLWKVMDSS